MLFTLSLATFLAGLAAIIPGCTAIPAPANQYSCVSLAEQTCDAQITPKGSAEEQCLVIDQIDWMNPESKPWVNCFCNSSWGRQVSEKWWDCFYTRASQRPADQNSQTLIWHQEVTRHRQMRRLYCVDDWKPNPPWHKMNHNFVNYIKPYYHVGRQYEYIWDYN